MKAAVINSYGSPEVFQYTDVEKPQIKSDEMLVKVYASSVNPVEWKIRQGKLKILTGNNFPMILGFDVSGEVVEIGNQVTGFKPGDLIYARLNKLPGGAYAEYAAVPKETAALKPANMSHEEAAAFPLAGLTALQGLRDEGGMKPGHKVLINGASGGVGTYAVEIAKAMQVEVTGVCSAKNIGLVQSLGADRVIDYKQQDFTKESIQYDIIFDIVGNRSFDECSKVLKPNGVYITTQPYPQNYLESFIRSLIPGKKYKVILVQSRGEDLAYIKELIEAGKIRSVIARTYPLSEVAAAHAASETEHTTGKIVIKVAS